MDPAKKLRLTKFSELSGENVVLSKYCGIPAAKRARLAKKTKNALVRGETSVVGVFSSVKIPDKMQVRGRRVKYNIMCKKITDYILTGWHSGAPVSRQACYTKCRLWCNKDDEFYKQYVDPNKSSARIQLCHWLTRLLKRIGFSSRKETVSQKIPNDWKEQSVAFSQNILKYFRDNNIDVVVCADQTFVRYLLAKEELLVPTGTRRVGTTVQSADERKGVTLMLSAFVRRNDDVDKITTGLLPPFIVYNGKTGATLDKRYSDWSRRPGHTGSMNFQQRHWFDAVITLRWINWLVVQFPQSLSIGLIWGACPSHKEKNVQLRINELEEPRRLFVADIPGGLTSILQ